MDESQDDQKSQESEPVENLEDQPLSSEENSQNEESTGFDADLDEYLDQAMEEIRTDSLETEIAEKMKESSEHDSSVSTQYTVRIRV